MATVRLQSFAVRLRVLEYREPPFFKTGRGEYSYVSLLKLFSSVVRSPRLFFFCSLNDLIAGTLERRGPFLLSR